MSFRRSAARIFIACGDIPANFTRKVKAIMTGLADRENLLRCGVPITGNLSADGRYLGYHPDVYSVECPRDTTSVK
jgi:hypothetical protein